MAIFNNLGILKVWFLDLEVMEINENLKCLNIFYNIIIIILYILYKYLKNFNEYNFYILKCK